MELTYKPFDTAAIIKIAVVLTALLFLYTAMTGPARVSIPVVYKSATVDSACLDVQGNWVPCP